MSPTGAAGPSPVGAPLPAGWRIELDPATRRLDDGRTVLGGSPLRVLRLGAGGVRLLDGLVQGGGPVPTTPGPAATLVRSLLDAGAVHPVPPVGAPSAPTTGVVTVVVPVRDDAAGLRATLGALAGPARSALVAEVVVVDDGSAARAATDIAAAVGGAGGRLVVHPANRGPAAARNRGWRTASTPLVAFLDAHVLPAPGWLDGLVAHLGDEAVALVAPRVRAQPGRGVRAAYEAVRSPLDLGPHRAPVRPRSPVPYVPSTALVARVAALADVGGFDERLRVGEDVDLVWRLVARGWRARYDPTTSVTHPVRSSWGAWLRQRHAYGTSAAALAERHGAAVAPVVASPWSATAWTLAVAGHPVPAVGATGAAVAALGRRLRGTGRRPRTAHPWRTAARLVGGGTLRAGEGLALGARRAWAPLLAPLALAGRRGRAVVVAVAVVPPLLEHRRVRPPLGRVRWCTVRAADDLAYCTGVWRGAVRRRSAAALRPAAR